MEEKIEEILRHTDLKESEIEWLKQELLNLYSVSGIISKIEKLKRFDFVQDGEWIGREYDEDGGCVDADDLKSITDSYR